MANEVAKTQPSFSMALTEKLDSMGDALPNGFNKARFVQNALALVNENPELGKYGASQIIAGLMKGAVLGLDFYAKEAYLIPYGSKLNFQTDYRGSIKLAKKYSIRPIKDIAAYVVRDGDIFDISNDGGNQSFTFKPKVFSNAPIVGAFAYAQFQDGGLLLDFMSLEEIENTRKQSKAKNSLPWERFFSEMAKKSVLRRLCKQIELDMNSDQMKIYNEEMAIMTDPKEIADAEIAEQANTEEFIESEVE